MIRWFLFNLFCRRHRPHRHHGTLLFCPLLNLHLSSTICMPLVVRIAPIFVPLPFYGFHCGDHSDCPWNGSLVIVVMMMMMVVIVPLLVLVVTKEDSDHPPSLGAALQKKEYYLAFLLHSIARVFYRCHKNQILIAVLPHFLRTWSFASFAHCLKGGTYFDVGRFSCESVHSSYVKVWHHKDLRPRSSCVYPLQLHV